jgi:hypothetical protein
MNKGKGTVKGLLVGECPGCVCVLEVGSLFNLKGAKWASV